MRGAVTLAAFYFSGAIATSIAIMSLFKKIEHSECQVLNIVEEYGKNMIVLLLQTIF